MYRIQIENSTDENHQWTQDNNGSNDFIDDNDAVRIEFPSYFIY